MKIGVRIMPRTEVLDSQGRAVEKTLRQHGRDVDSVRVGKFVILDVKETDKGEALKRAQDIAQFALHNPLIEIFNLELVE